MLGKGRQAEEGMAGTTDRRSQAGKVGRARQGKSRKAGRGR
jgi:hypothetical protein